jgi:hypothetical protein
MQMQARQMRAGLVLVGWLACGPAMGQGAPACRNLADPATDGIWSIDSAASLPRRFQFDNLPQGGEGFSGLAGISATDIWAVGGDTTFGAAGEAGNAVVYHSDGTSWCRVNDPDLQSPEEYTTLNGVAALAADNVWAVGSRITPSPAELLSVIQHWDGTKWKTVPSPDPGYPFTVAGVLNGVSAVAADDIWAVGYYEDSSGNEFALLAHYDGKAWSAVTPPALPGNIVLLTRVFARAHDDVWAAGIQGSDGELGQTLIEHFDGTAWSVVPGDNAPGGANILNGVMALAAHDAWAVGATLRSPRGLNYVPLAEHWNGTSWKRVATPQTGVLTNVLSGVAARSGGDVWAAGYSSTGDALGNGDVTPLVEHWTGGKWVVVPAAPANVPGSVRKHKVKFPQTTIGSALTDIAVFPAGAGAVVVAAAQYNTQVAVPSAGGGTTKLAKRHPYTITTSLP